jgi:hypothetical protein
MQIFQKSFQSSQIERPAEFKGRLPVVVGLNQPHRLRLLLYIEKISAFANQPVTIRGKEIKQTYVHLSNLQLQ